MHCLMEEQPYSLLMFKISAQMAKCLKLVIASQIQLATKFIQFSVYTVLYVMTCGTENKSVLKKTSFMPDMYFSVLWGKI